jgi:hypothetical protein
VRFLKRRMRPFGDATRGSAVRQLRGALPRCAPALDSKRWRRRGCRPCHRTRLTSLAGARLASRTFLSDATSVFSIRAHTGTFSCATRPCSDFASRVALIVHPVKSQFPISEFAIGESRPRSNRNDRTNHPNRNPNHPNRTCRDVSRGLSPAKLRSSTLCFPRSPRGASPPPLEAITHHGHDEQHEQVPVGEGVRGGAPPPPRVRRTPPRWRARRRNAP